ncbi:MAG: ABC transporter substrate-binding protein, partial [Nitrospirota bacterium]
MAGLVAGGAALFLKLSNQGPEEGALFLSGNVEVTEVDVGFEIPGRVMELQKDEGERVGKGEPLASLDSAELEAQAAHRRAAIDEARARLRELRAGARPQELEEARARLNQAKAELEKAGKDFERAGVLYSNGAISAQQMDAARRAFDVADARHREARESLSLVDEGPRKEVIEAQESRVRQARAALAAAVEKLKDASMDAP